MLNTRRERDRFIAFAFAAADLLLELDKTHKIEDVLGASNGVLGYPSEHLIGKRLDDLVVAEDRSLVRRAIAASFATGRTLPVAIRLTHASGGICRAQLGACRIPSLLDHLCVTLALSPAHAELLAKAERDPESGLIDRQSLLALAGAEALDPATTASQLTLMRVEGLNGLPDIMAPEKAQGVVREIAAVLRLYSVGGDSAGRLGPDTFGLVETSPAKTHALVRDINDVAKSMGVDPQLLNPVLSSVALASDGLSDGDIEKALAHSIKRFLDPISGGGTPIVTLKEELAEAVAATMTKITHLRNQIQTNDIRLHFQPIVSLATQNIHHYEALARKADGTTAIDAIAFGEEVGMIADIDLMILKMALRHIGEDAGAVVAVNLSGQSLQLESFRNELRTTLETTYLVKSRLIFELTESAAVTNIGEVAAFLSWLRNRGHRICLDDFGAGAATYNYLRNFDVDFVKIDGPFMRSAVSNPKDYALIASIVRLCDELHCQTVGEMIEDQREADMAKQLGITFGQGWFFGRPVEALPELERNRPRLGKRQGAYETWG